MQRELLMGSIVLAVACACVDQGPAEKQIDPAYVQKNLLSEPPAQMTNAVNADLGGKVLYLGNEVDKTTLAPGDKAKVVHYWKVITPPGERWRVFTHLVGQGTRDWRNFDYSDMRTGYGPGQWKAGDIIRDEQEIQLPSSWKAPVAEMLVGLFPKGGHTAADRMPVVSGPADKESRVKALRFQVRRSKKSTPAAGGYVIRKAAGPITIDGRADEASWKSAPESPVFTDAEGSPAVKGKTRARLLWDDQNLYAFVSVEDADVFSQYSKQDEPLWREDVVELFIDADRNRRGYVELQVNPNNAHFDAWFATTRGSGSDTAWNAGMSSAVVVHGTKDERGDTDRGWDVEIAIPLSAVKGQDQSMKVALPPRPGNRWRLNVVRIDKPEDGRLAAGSWSRITYQDFHALDRMIDVTFGDAEGNTRPAPQAQVGSSDEPAGKPAAEPSSTGAGKPAAAPSSTGAGKPTGAPGE